MFRKKYLTALISAALVIFSASFTLAEEERPQHYAPEEITSVEGALKLLNDKLPLVEETLAQEKFEKIHEISYSLEAAVDKLREGPKTKERVDAVDELDATVQTVHYASEKHDIAALKESVPALKEHIAKTEKLY